MKLTVTQVQVDDRARQQAREDAEQERYLRAWREQHSASSRRRRLLPWQHAA